KQTRFADEYLFIFILRVFQQKIGSTSVFESNSKSRVLGNIRGRGQFFPIRQQSTKMVQDFRITRENHGVQMDLFPHSFTADVSMDVGSNSERSFQYLSNVSRNRYLLFNPD